MDLLHAIEQVRQWLGQRETRRREKRGDAASLLGLLHAAANTTRAYIADMEHHGRGRSRDKEQALSTAWVAVGEALARMDDPASTTLYRRVFIKAKYWSDPSAWDETRTREAGIGLEDLTEEIDAALEHARDA